MKYYPLGTDSILDFYEGEFESCFILFHPFLKMKNHEDELLEHTRSAKLDSLPKEFNDIFNSVKLPENTRIYATNTNYPEEIVIIESGIEISWKTIIELSTQLNSFHDVQKALRTSIGAYRDIFERNDLFKNLKETLEKQKMIPPHEDIINTLTKKKLFEILNFLNQKEIVIDNFTEIKTPINISDISLIDFCNTLKSSYIYSLGREVMISQYRDTFFCLLLTKKKETMQTILDNFELEGILCDQETSLPWEFDKVEFEKLLEKEKEQKISNKSSKFWSRLFKK
jgi:hypothetical protein